MFRQGDPLLDREFGGAEFDLLSDVGFLNALYHASPLEEGGGMMLAPVCGTFVFLLLGETGLMIDLFLGPRKSTMDS